MGRLLKRYAQTLKALNGGCPTLRALILRGTAQDNKKGGFLDCLAEIAYNVLKGNVKLTPQQHRRLRPHRQPLRTLASKRASRKSKTRAIQKGGFLAALIPTIVGALGALLR